jgi:hypothetical protein
MRTQVTVNDNPAGTVVLPCDCVVASRPGQLASCPKGHDQAAPQHRQSVIRPRTRG